jgi:Flp pilus assembly protein TadG
MTGTCQKQKGAAAMEFALALPILMVLLWGLLSFAALFYTQMAVARAAHDGARAASLVSPSADVAAVVRAAVLDSLAATPIAAQGHNSSYSSRRDWLAATVTGAIAVTSAACDSATCVTVRISYPYGDGVRLLPNIALPGMGMMSFLPDTLIGEAVAVR